MLLFKIILAPALIALVSLAGRRWGPGVAGWLLGLPLNSGPILLFLALEHGPQFTSEAARGCLLGILAWGAFCLVYAFCCLKMSWWWSTLAGWLAYSIVGFALVPVKLNVTWASVAVAVMMAGTLLVFPRARHALPPPAYPRYEIWLRMASASAMVVTLTGVAAMLGPTRSGILSDFPAYTTILAVFSHRLEPSLAVQLLRGVTLGLYTAATFFLVLSLSLLRVGEVLSFALALMACLFVQTISLIHVRRRA